MSDLNIFVIVAAAVAAFVTSMIWYIVVPVPQPAEASAGGTPSVHQAGSCSWSSPAV